MVPHGQRDGSLRPYFRFSRRKPILFLSSSFPIVFTRLSEPRSRPSNSQKIWWRRESNPDFWICSQELWTLHHRGGGLRIVQFNSILYYLSAESTATRPITDTAQRRYKNNNSNTIIIRIIIVGKVKQCSNNNDNNNNIKNNNNRPKQSTDLIIIIIQFNSIFYY
jgi:hypothetical protein